MNNFLRYLIAFIVYRIISTATGIYHNFLTEPFNLMAILLDLGLFLVTFFIIWWITGKIRLGGASGRA